MEYLPWPRKERTLPGILSTEEVKRLMEKGKVAYHLSYEELEGSLPKKRWVVNHQWPTTEPKVIEEYLGRYTCLPARLPMVYTHLDKRLIIKLL